VKSKRVVVDSGRGISRWVVGLVVHPALLSVSLNEPATITLKIIFGYETEKEKRPFFLDVIVSSVSF
jgi:hypothetical protein